MIATNFFQKENIMKDSVTPLETIRIASQGSLVDIPGFSDGETITVRLRKPNMLTLIKTGKIPNNLLHSATTLFDGAKRDKKGYSQEELSSICEIMTVLCEACLVAPTYKELTDAGIELTQEQMTFIFNYSQGGVKSLAPFRNKSKHHSDAGDGSEVAVQTKSIT